MKKHLILSLVLFSLFFFLQAGIFPERAWCLSSLLHPFGCSPLGEDMLSLVLAGTGETFFTALSGRILAMLLSFFSLVVAYFSGKAGMHLLARISEALITIPSLLFALAGASVLGSGLLSLIAAIALSEWAISTRWLLGRLQEYERREFVMAGKIMGAGRAHVFKMHFLPFIFADFLLLFAVFFPSSLMTVAVLEFLGFSGGIERPGLGYLTALTKDYIFFRPLLTLAPVIAMVSLVWWAFAVKKTLEKQTRVE